MADIGLSAEDRELLERFAPYLQYDAQDGYRATSAATMTDPATRRRGSADEKGHANLDAYVETKTVWIQL